jgi:RNA polymerase sigma-70 factor (ECF subfamily)
MWRGQKTSTESPAGVSATGVAIAADTDAALIARARHGDHDAFATLIVSRADRVLRTARAILRDESAAHDAAQNTLVAAWIHLPRLRDTSKFDAWINSVLRNECRMALRKRGKVREIDLTTAELAGGPAVTTPDPSKASIETAAVKRAFGRLSIDDRTILLLHHLHGLPLEEVASQLGLSIGTAKSRLFRARRALERALETER